MLKWKTSGSKLWTQIHEEYYDLLLDGSIIQVTRNRKSRANDNFIYHDTQLQMNCIYAIQNHYSQNMVIQKDFVFPLATHLAVSKEQCRKLYNWCLEKKKLQKLYYFKI